MHDTPFFLVNETATELLARLPLLAVKPKIIVDMSWDEGMLAQGLKAYYPQAEIIKHVFSEAQLASPLAYDSASVDLITANFLLPWLPVATIKQLLSEWKRILRVDGVVLFNALGLDSLREYQLNWPQDRIIPHLQDMHNVGDSLIQSGFLDPVLDVMYYQIAYKESAKMFLELQAGNMVKMLSTPKNYSQSFDLTFEVVQAHAFAPQINTQESIIKIPISQIKYR